MSCTLITDWVQSGYSNTEIEMIFDVLLGKTYKENLQSEACLSFKKSYKGENSVQQSTQDVHEQHFNVQE